MRIFGRVIASKREIMKGNFFHVAYLAVILSLTVLLMIERCGSGVTVSRNAVATKIVDSPPDTVSIPGETNVYFKEVEVIVRDSAALAKVLNQYKALYNASARIVSALQDSIKSRDNSLSLASMALDDLKLQIGKHGIMDIVETDEYKFAYQIESMTPIDLFNYDIDVKSTSTLVYPKRNRFGLHVGAWTDGTNARDLYMATYSNGNREVGFGWMPNRNGMGNAFQAHLGLEFQFGKYE